MTDAPSSATLKKKKKKSHSLVRKLSLNKFRMSPEQQEPRHTPEGGNSSRSQSQSSQESPVRATKKESDDSERGKEVKEELKKPEKLLEKPAKTVSVVQGKSPSLTTRSFAGTVQQGELCMDAMGREYKTSAKLASKRVRDIRFLTTISLNI